MTETGRSLPASPDDYFAECVAGAERAGLRIIGKASIDSNSHPLRDCRVIPDTEVPVVLFRRRVTLLLSLPGHAFLARATHDEEHRSDPAAARQGRVVAYPGHPFWTISLFCGTLPGRWTDGVRHLRVAQSFDETRLTVDEETIHSHHSAADGKWIALSCDGRTPFDERRDVCDGLFHALLGYYPYVATAGRFGEAMTNMVDALRPHLRAGKLLPNHVMTGLIPLDAFPTCADAFVAQCPPACLLQVMDVIPYELRSAESIARSVELSNRLLERH